MVWIGSVRCENFYQDIVARTFALIAPVWRILHQVCAVALWSQMHPNGKKRMKT